MHRPANHQPELQQCDFAHKPRSPAPETSLMRESLFAMSFVCRSTDIMSAGVGLMGACRLVPISLEIFSPALVAIVETRHEGEYLCAIKRLTLSVVRRHTQAVQRHRLGFARILFQKLLGRQGFGSRHDGEKLRADKRNRMEMAELGTDTRRNHSR